MKQGSIAITNVLILFSVILTCHAAEDKDNQDVKIVDNVIHFFPSNPKEGIIVRHQIPGERILVSAVRTNGKTRHIEIYNTEKSKTSVKKSRKTKVQKNGTTKVRKEVKFLYPFGSDSAAWTLDVKQKGNIVTVHLSSHSVLIGDLMDFDEGSDEADKARKKLGVTGNPTIANLPVLFSGGDSISLGYWPYLEGELWKEIDVYHRKELFRDFPGRFGKNNFAPLAYANLEKAYATKKFKPDYMMINFGLHMIRGYSDKVEEYGQWVGKFAELAKKHQARFIWINTTPYDSSRMKDNITIQKFNAVAAKIAKKHNVPVIDLYTYTNSLIKKSGEKNVYNGGCVHFSEDTKRLQGTFIATRIRDIIGTKK